MTVLLSRNTRDDLGRAFSELVGKGRGIRVIPCGLGTSEGQCGKLEAFKNTENVWIEF